MALRETTVSRRRLLILSIVVSMVTTMIDADSRDLHDFTSASDVMDGFAENEVSVDDVIRSRDNEIGASPRGRTLPGWSREAGVVSRAWTNEGDDGASSEMFRRPDKKLRYGFHAIRGKRLPRQQQQQPRRSV